MFAVLSGTVFGVQVLSCRIGLVSLEAFAVCVAFLFVTFFGDKVLPSPIVSEVDSLLCHSQSPAKQTKSAAEAPPAHIRHVEGRGRFVFRLAAPEYAPCARPPALSDPFHAIV